MSNTEIDYRAHPVLFVDDEQDNLDTIRHNFKKLFDLHTATSGEEGLEILKALDPAVIVSDQRMKPNQYNGIQFLQKARKVRHEAVGVILTAYPDVPDLIDAVNSGDVYRYLTKPFDSKELRITVCQAIERHVLLRENRRLVERLKELASYHQQESEARFNFGELIGKSQELEKVLATIKQVAPTASTVLLRGESGTGKELIARAIHNNSPRKDKPFVKVSCAALAPGILESELFGHEKGSFTSAIGRKLGRFELADEGTIFLDEVGDIPMETQVKLLRVLQEREFERVGGTETIRVDVRIVSATNRPLEELIRTGKFREDLYYRLNVFPIVSPPLRKRASDIPVLARHFIAKFGKVTGKQVRDLSDGSLTKLMSYQWPGNVRELENVMERALILAQHELIDEGDLDFGSRPMSFSDTPTSSVSSPGALTQDPSGQRGEGLTGILEDIERRRLVEAMNKHNGRKAEAARDLGINRSTLYYRLKKYGLLSEE
jgi:two-component system, NtrC family, response regulator AtoC